MQTIAELRAAWLTACGASLSVVVLSVVLGILLARVARDGARPPLVAVPLVLSVAGGWCALLLLLWPGF